MKQKQGKKITLFLVDGEPDGIRTITLGGWNGLGLVFPRNKLKELGNNEFAKKPGVYFLFGRDSENSLIMSAYIGEAENIFDRLTTHNNDKGKDFWYMTIAFVSSDESLTKAHVKYLESCCIERAYDAEHFGYILKNGKESFKSHLPASDISVMEDFISNIDLLLTAIGYPILQKIEAKETISFDKESPVFRCRNLTAGTEGIAKMTNEGFVVFKGSSMPTNYSSSAAEKYKKVVERLVSEGIIEIVGDKYIFKQDYKFTSPSTPAILILGYPINGWEIWKTDGGKTLDEIYRHSVVSA